MLREIIDIFFSFFFLFFFFPIIINAGIGKQSCECRMQRAYARGSHRCQSNSFKLIGPEAESVYRAISSGLFFSPVSLSLSLSRAHYAPTLGGCSYLYARYRLLPPINPMLLSRTIICPRSSPGRYTDAVLNALEDLLFLELGFRVVIFRSFSPPLPLTVPFSSNNENNNQNEKKEEKFLHIRFYIYRNILVRRNLVYSNCYYTCNYVRVKFAKRGKGSSISRVIERMDLDDASRYVGGVVSRYWLVTTPHYHPASVNRRGDGWPVSQFRVVLRVVGIEFLFLSSFSSPFFFFSSSSSRLLHFLSLVQRFH